MNRRIFPLILALLAGISISTAAYARNSHPWHSQNPPPAPAPLPAPTPTPTPVPTPVPTSTPAMPLLIRCMNYGHFSPYDLSSGGQVDRDIATFKRSGYNCVRMAYAGWNNVNVEAVALRFK